MTIDFDKVDWNKKLAAAGVNEASLIGKGKPCPICGGKDRFRFDNKGNYGTWFCQQCGPGNGYSLLRKLGMSAAEVLRFLDDGTVTKTDAPRPAFTFQDEDFSPAKVAKNRERLRKAWQQSVPLNGADAASRYLQMRVPGCDISRLGIALRYHRGMQFWEEDDNGKYHLRGYFPVLLGAAVDGAGNPINCHRTYLTPEGKKAPFEMVKKQMKGVRKLDGAAIRVVNVPESRVLGLSEGIENAVAVGTAYRYGINVWSMLNCGNLEVADIPQGRFDKIIIFADHDRIDPKTKRRPGEHHARLLKARLEEAGYLVDLKIPPVEGTDFADLWLQVFAARRVAQEETEQRLVSRAEAVSKPIPGAVLASRNPVTSHAVRN